MQKKTTTIKIKPLGIGAEKDIVLTEDECFQLERGPIVIKHDKLLSIASQETITADEIICDSATYVNKENFSYIYRARTKVATGELIEEIGEANPINLDTRIGQQYPALMAHKRALDRLMLRLLGVSGEIYSDTEISRSNDDAKALTSSTSGKAEKPVKNIKPAEKSETPKEEKSEPEAKTTDTKPVDTKPAAETPKNETPAASTAASLDPESMSIEEFEKNLCEDLAYKTPAKFGSHKDEENFTLKDLATLDKDAVGWVKNTFKVTDHTKEPMQKLKLAVCYLVDNGLLKLA